MRAAGAWGFPIFDSRFLMADARELSALRVSPKRIENRKAEIENSSKIGQALGRVAESDHSLAGEFAVSEF